MPKSVCQWLSGAAVLLVASAAWAQLAQDITDAVKDGVPVVGLDVGAALPISSFRSSGDPGGSVSPWVGWQIGSGAGFTITPVLQAQYAGFTKSSSNNDAPSFTSLGGGARAALNDEAAEIYFGAGGNYYWATSGPLDNGGGFNLNGGVNYEFWRGTALGIFARYDQVSVNSTPSDDLTKFMTTGLEVRHRFLPEPPPPPPPPPAPVAAAPAPPVKKKIVLRGVNFDFDKANIRADAVPILEEAAKTLKEESELTVSVNGYTDSVGTEAYNLRLSERRADAVRAYLEKLGVAGSRLTARGFGKSNPVASNETAEGRAQNRRVELIVNP
ncbi:OmpA family protein [bacterium]|nr:OmpA family protein [bacterium]